MPASLDPYVPIKQAETKSLGPSSITVWRQWHWMDLSVRQWCCTLNVLLIETCLIVDTAATHMIMIVPRF